MQILHAKPHKYDNNCRIIMVDLGATRPHRYVTWVQNIKTGDRFWGHYIADRDEAFADFCQR